MKRGVRLGGLGLVAVLALVAVATAAHPVSGAVYTSQPTMTRCTPKGVSCTFTFRVSRDGKQLSFASKEDVVSGWACHGGGGEALFGTNKSPLGRGSPVPTATIHADGSFKGIVRWVDHGRRSTLVEAGRFTGSGKTATLKFTLDPGPQSCTSGPLTIHTH